MDAPGSRIGPRPAAWAAAADSAAAFLAWPPAGSGPLDDPGLMPISHPGIQTEDTGGIRIVLARVPAARPLRRDRRSVPPSGMADPVPHAPADGGASAMAIRKTRSGA
jgi:hypothetical protein